MSSAGSQPTHATTLPERLGRYEVLAKLASGGMASVVLARAVGAAGFERVVAIKLCHPHLAEDPAFRTMFLDEARLAARIHHPNVVATIDVSDGDALYLVMDYVEGGRVSDLVSIEAKRGGRVPIPIALRIAVDALSGLHAAHTALGPDGEPLRIVHRDVSPQNVLVGVDGVTRVVDFGIAKAEARSTVTGENELKGKLAYMAPEQVRSIGVTARSDLFAAAVVAWEVLTAERLFAGDSRSDVLQRVLYAPIPRPSLRRPEIPAAVEAVIVRALAREPSERFDDARAFAEALERSGTPIASHREVGDYVATLLAETLALRRAALRGHAATDVSVHELGTAVSGVLRTTGQRRPARSIAWVAIGVALLLAAVIGVAVAVAMTTSADEVAEPADPRGLERAPASARMPEGMASGDEDGDGDGNEDEDGRGDGDADGNGLGEANAPDVANGDTTDRPRARPLKNRRRPPRMRGEFEPPTI